MLALLYVVALAVGVLVGAVGVGGLILPAALSGPGGLGAHEAAATSSWAFVFTGAVAAVVLVSTGRVRWRSGGALALGAAPGALVGALLSGVLPGVVLTLALAAVTLGAGWHGLRTAHPVERATALPLRWILPLGFVVGVGSAVTGTGGPVLLVPALLALGVPTLESIELGQLVQVPVVACTVIGLWPQGTIDVRLGSVLGVLAGIGVVAGLFLARRVPAAGLRRATSLVLVGTGVYLVVHAVAA